MTLEQIAEIFVKDALKNQVFKLIALQKLKNEYSSKYKIKNLLHRDIVSAYKRLIDAKQIEKNQLFENVIRKRSVRTESGITSVTIATKPYACPGKCVFCPTEKNVPKSYASNEPGIMRAILNDYDPYKQVVNRLHAYLGNGHEADKVEMIIIGGTFSFYPHIYQTNFVRNMFNALNRTEKRELTCPNWYRRGAENVHFPKVKSLKLAQDLNEKAQHRCVGLSVETRPDYITEDELKRFRMLGVTRIEMGVQHTIDRILHYNKRGHGIQAVRNAMQLMKDAGFKITSHMMPNLPGASLSDDYQSFVDIFDDPYLRTDWMKIYPCSVVPYSELETWWRDGKHKSYSQDEIIDLLVRVKQIVPTYIRLTRVIRDIPDNSILEGSTVSNLRQYIHQIIKKNPDKWKNCRCIRCREIRSFVLNYNDTQLNCYEYDAQGGKEFFLSFDDMKKDKICANLRLRYPSQFFTGKKHFIQELEGAAIIRELHVFGAQAGIGDRQIGLSQHSGFGTQLMKKAEEMAKKAGFKKIAVISGIGVREYYRKLGYKLDGTYMTKDAMDFE